MPPGFPGLPVPPALGPCGCPEQFLNQPPDPPPPLAPGLAANVLNEAPPPPPVAVIVPIGAPDKLDDPPLAPSV